MSGERNLNKLLASMSPLLMEGEYVFTNFKDAQYGDHAHLDPIASMLELEGLTLVIPQARADEYTLSYDSTFRGISLQVHSSLDAVGLTAALANKLTQHGISANVIAGFFHDHVFIKATDAKKAMKALQEFQH